MSRVPRDPRPPRSLRRDGDGALYDLDERRAITVGELAEDVRVGRRFRCTQQGSERECTQQVLLEVLGSSGPVQPASLAAGAQLTTLAGAAGAIAGAIADRRGDDGRPSTGTVRHVRPRLVIDDEEE